MPIADSKLEDHNYAEIIAYLFECYGVMAGGAPLPTQLTALEIMRMPSKEFLEKTMGGTAGGLTPGVTLPPWPVPTDRLGQIRPVTDSLLASPPDGSWLSWRRTRDGAGFSPLRQITKENVQHLRVAWTLALTPGPNQTTPLVHDGVIFVQSHGDHIQALDARSGERLWHFHRELAAGAIPLVHRNLALYGDQLYSASSDLRMLAIAIKTGRLSWEQAFGDATRSEARGGPIIAKGVVMQGASGDRLPGGGFVTGFDADSGRVLWRFNTIARPDDVHGNSWNGLPLERRTGGSVWTAGTYDEELELAFFGPSPTYNTEALRTLATQPEVTNAALYTNSTVALNPLTGRLVWHYQHLSNDQWDLDWAFERHIIPFPVDGMTKKLLLTSGKLGIYDALNAQDGRYLFSLDLGIQNLVTSIDSLSGDKTVDLTLSPGSGTKVIVCPHSSGGKNWLPAAVNTATHVVFTSVVESCMDILPMPKGRGLLTAGAEFTLRPPPGSDGRYGRLQAIDLKSRSAVWIHRQRSPIVTGVLATAGDLIFVGSLDRWFAAHSAVTGEILWRIRLNDVPNTAPITFLADGKQYVAIVVGGGFGVAAAFTPLVPEVNLPLFPSSTIWVFELPSHEASTQR